MCTCLYDRLLAPLEENSPDRDQKGSDISELLIMNIWTDSVTTIFFSEHLIYSVKIKIDSTKTMLHTVTLNVHCYF